MRQRTHHGQAIAQDEAVRPIHIVLIKLHRLPVFLLRVGEQFALHIFPLRRLHDGLRAHALVDMQRNRIDGERFRLLFARPFEPRVCGASAPPRGFALIDRERFPLRLFEQLRQSVGVAALVESQNGGRCGL